MSSTFPTKNEPSCEKRASQFVRRLRYLRDRQGVTQADVSSVLGVTKSTISLWENGDTIPDAKSIAALADYYSVSCDYLLCKSDSLKGKNGVAVDELGLNEKTIQVLEDDTYVQQRKNRIAFLDALITDENFQRLCDGFATGYNNSNQTRHVNYQNANSCEREHAKACLFDCIQYFSVFLHKCTSIQQK